MVRETGRVSHRVHTRLTTAAHAAQDKRQRDPPGTAPSLGSEGVQRGASPAAQPRQGSAAVAMSLVLRQPPRAPRSRPVDPGAKAPVGQSTTATGKPTRGPRTTRPDEARCTPRSHQARQRSTLPATTKAHRGLPSNHGHRVPQTREVCATRNKPTHRRRCWATPNRHTTNPSQEWRVCRWSPHTNTHTPTPQPAVVGRNQSPNPKPKPTLHNPARTGGVQGERAHKHTHRNTPARIGGVKAKTRTQAHSPTAHTRARNGGVQAERAENHTHTHPNTAARNGGAQLKPERSTHNHTAHPVLARAAPFCQKERTNK